MTPTAFAVMVADAYPSFRLHHLHPGVCKHAVVRPELLELVGQSNGLFTSKMPAHRWKAARSHSCGMGTGPRRILLWSQMHGDEPTATLALLDILNGMLTWRSEPWFTSMVHEVSIVMHPDAES